MFKKQLSLRIWLTLLLLFPISVTQAFSSVPDDLPNSALNSQAETDTETALEKPLEALKPSIRQIRTAEEILLKLQRRHYTQRQFDDELSSALFDNYLKYIFFEKNKTLYITSKAKYAEIQEYKINYFVTNQKLPSDKREKIKEEIEKYKKFLKSEMEKIE